MNLAAFDTLASRYDELWIRSAIGRSQRVAVWREMDSLFQRGDRVLDLGCGTGEDALHLMSFGIDVEAIDKSGEMVRMARGRGVDAKVLDMENLPEGDARYDGAISNFGALNCVRELASIACIRMRLAQLVRPGGHLMICIIGRFCPWETLWYLFHGRPAKAVRRWSGQCFSPSLGIHVSYPSGKEMKQAFAPEFDLVRWSGIGLLVPPSYVAGLSPQAVKRLDWLDRKLSWLPLLRACSDHRLFVFRRR